MQIYTGASWKQGLSRACALPIAEALATLVIMAALLVTAARLLQPQLPDACLTCALHCLQGTSQQLEKSYFRLTSAPDPATVRPEPVLRAALDRLLRLIRGGATKYLYVLDQFKVGSFAVDTAFRGFLAGPDVDAPTAAADGGACGHCLLCRRRRKGKPGVLRQSFLIRQLPDAAEGMNSNPFRKDDMWFWP